MKTNARGDILGAGNQIAMGRNQLMDQVYAVADSGEGYSPNDPANFQAVMEASSAEKLSNLANNLTVPLTPTPTATEEAPDATPAARGSLAGSVAKTATVAQTPIPDPRKPKNSGPTRI